MIPFLRTRILSSAVPLVCVVLGVFFLARMTGNPVDLYLPLSATPEQRAEFSAAQGFDLSIPVQLWNYLTDAAHLDFGTSLRTGRPRTRRAPGGCSAPSTITSCSRR